jgi:thiamine pyrophosphokinase
MKSDSGPEIAFVGRSGRRKTIERAAVIALEGARANDLRLSLRWAERFHPLPVLVAVDGWLSTCKAIRRRPGLFVGDLDSAHAAPVGIPSRIYPVAKDFSDFSGALAEVRALRADVVVVAGLLGGRLDHEWANLLEVGAFAPAFAGLVAPSSRGLVVVTAAGVRARGADRRRVSVFALGGAALVTLRGACWTLTRRRIAPGSLGLSNVAGDDLVLDVHEGVAALVFPNPRAR